VSLSLPLLLAASVFGQLPSAKKCNQSARECEQEIRQMLTGRLYLGIEVEEKTFGLTVKTVVPESPAWRADFETGDRLMSVNGSVTSQASIKEFKQIITQLLDKPNVGRLSFIVQRQGILKKLDAHPEPYSRAQIDKIVAQHLLEAHTVTAQQGTPRQQ
jgi:predicted metalloprotease with PDZ domain